MTFSHCFRISKRTTFKELRDASVKYWDLKDDYSYAMTKRERK